MFNPIAKFLRLSYLVINPSHIRYIACQPSAYYIYITDDKMTSSDCIKITEKKDKEGYDNITKFIDAIKL